MKLNTTYHEHCVSTMNRMEANTIPLVMTSTPYAKAREKQYGGVAPDHYLEWFRPIAEAVYRVLAKDGSFILNINDVVVKGETHLFAYEIPVMLKRELGFKFIDAFIWHKKTCPPGKYPNRFKDAWEFCYHFSKNVNIKFNPLAVATPVKDETIARLNRDKSFHNPTSQTNSGITIPNAKMARRLRGTQSCFSSNDSSLDAVMTALPSNVLHLSPVTVNTGHPAAFPSELPEFFIKAFTNPGDTVYDPFHGGGTTGETALKLGRNFIASETQKRFVLKSNKRIKPFLP